MDDEVGLNDAQFVHMYPERNIEFNVKVAKTSKKTEEFLEEMKKKHGYITPDNPSEYFANMYK